MTEMVLAMRILLKPSGALLMALISMLYATSGMASHHVLVLNGANVPPYSNREHSGFFDVIATEAFRRAGLELRIASVPSERALLLSNGGVSDGVLSRTSVVRDLYPNLIHVPESLGDWYFVGFSKDASIPARIESIRGRTVGILRGWKIYELALAGAKDVITVDDPDQLFRLLQLNRIEVALYEREMGLAYIRKHAIGGVHYLAPPLFVRQVFIHLHMRHRRQVPALAAALRTMKEEGTYQRTHQASPLLHSDRSPR